MPSQKSNKNKKRDAPEQKEWNWEDTVICGDDDTTSLLGEDIKALLLTRGCKSKKIKTKKENIKLLKNDFEVELEKEFEAYTVKELLLELKLRGLNSNSAKKKELIQRLRGEIDATAPPPKKKQKRGGNFGRKKKSDKVFVVAYNGEVADDKDDKVVMLGVYKSQKKAYQVATERLIEDIKARFGEKDKKKMEKELAKIADIEEGDKKMEAANDCVGKTFDNDQDAPYCDVHETTLNSSK